MTKPKTQQPKGVPHAPMWRDSEQGQCSRELDTRCPRKNPSPARPQPTCDEARVLIVRRAAPSQHLTHVWSILSGMIAPGLIVSGMIAPMFTKKG